MHNYITCFYGYRFQHYIYMCDLTVIAQVFNL